MIGYQKRNSSGALYATGDQWRNNSRKNEGMEPKQKQYPPVDVTGDRSKVWCSKEQYCIGTWIVRSMNQGKLEVVKQEMARVNVNILGSYAILLFTASDFTSITSYIQNCMLFSLWLCIFILYGVIYLFFSSTILGTYWPGEFIFQCSIFLSFHTVHGVLNARILKWFAISFCCCCCCC